MAAVTQLTPNFLGGVSRQTDDKKNRWSGGWYRQRIPWSYIRFDQETVYLLPLDTWRNLVLMRIHWRWAEGCLLVFSQTKIKVTEENKDKYPNDDVGDMVTHLTFVLLRMQIVMFGIPWWRTYWRYQQGVLTWRDLMEVSMVRMTITTAPSWITTIICNRKIDNQDGWEHRHLYQRVGGYHQA